MPLKHRTETGLVLLLGVIIALTGILLSLLPPFPEGVIGWLALFVLTLIYPLALQPMLRRNRADYEFRWLHAFPLLMVVVWGIVKAIAMFVSPFEVVVTLLSFLWGLPAVVIGIVLLGIFCAAVVRRAVLRVRLLTGLLGAFLILGLFAYMLDINSAVRASLFDGTVLTQNPVVAMLQDMQTDASDDAKDEDKDRDEDDDRTDDKDKDEDDEKDEDDYLAIDDRMGGMIGKRLEETPKLPKSGGEVGAMAIAFMSTYCGVLHMRVKKRK